MTSDCHYEPTQGMCPAQATYQEQRSRDQMHCLQGQPRCTRTRQYAKVETPHMAHQHQVSSFLT